MHHHNSAGITDGLKNSKCSNCIKDSSTSITDARSFYTTRSISMPLSVNQMLLAVKHSAQLERQGGLD